MKVLVQYGCYQCGECHNALRFEASRENCMTNLSPDASAIGSCPYHRCSQYEQRVKVTLPTIEVQALPRLAEWGDLNG